jgi:hypothetical protein
LCIDMNIDESDTENIVLQHDGDGGRKPGVQSTRSGGKRRTLNSAFTPDHEFRGEEEDEGTGYTQVTRRKTRSTSSPMNTRIAKKATPVRATIRVMEDEGRKAAGVVQADQLTFLRNLVESVLRQLQKQEEIQKALAEASALETAELRKLVEKQNNEMKVQSRKIEALHALSQENVRNPSYSQVAQMGITQPKEAQGITPSSSLKESSTPQSARHDERAVSIDAGRSKVGDTDFKVIKDKLQQGIDKAKVTQGCRILFLRPGPGERIEVIFENKAQAEKARKHTQWATGQLQGSRVQGEKWYPVKCDMVAKQAVLDRSVADNRTLQPTICQNFGKDNVAEGIDFTAAKVHWLSKADYKKKVGSLVIWLKSKFAADHLINTGTALFGATGAHCSKWELREKELPCFNCNRYGHKQAECKSKPRCALCTKEHSRHNCPKDTLLCASCGTAGHCVMDWQCPHHPSHWKYVGKTRAEAKQSSRIGTTRISEAIHAKHQALEKATAQATSGTTRKVVAPTTGNTTQEAAVPTAKNATQKAAAPFTDSATQKTTQGPAKPYEREVEMTDATEDTTTYE